MVSVWKSSAEDCAVAPDEPQRYQVPSQVPATPQLQSFQVNPGMHKFLCNRQHIPKHVQNYLPAHSSKCTVNFHESPVTFPQLFFSWLVRVTEDFFCLLTFQYLILQQGRVLPTYWVSLCITWQKRKKEFSNVCDLKKKMWAANTRSQFLLGN